MAADVKQWLQILPLPLANALRRAHNDKTALGRHNGAYYFFESSLKLAACAQIGVYLAHDGHDPKLNEELKQLARASAGTWLYLLHTFSRYTSQRSDAALLPLSRIHERLTKPAQLPAARAFVDRDAPEPANGKLSVQDLFAALVAHRNDEMGHGAQRESGFYERIAPLILDATLEALQLVQPFENLKLALTRVTPDEKTGEARHGFTVLDGTGIHGWEEDEAQLPAGRLWLIGGAVRVPLHPLLIYESGEYDRIGFLNKVVGRPKAGAVVVKRCEYLDYYSGERLQSRDAAAELAALFSRLHKTTVSTEEVERLSLEDGSEADTRVAVPAQPSTTIGDFEILGELGRGGMGIVYKARQLTLGRIVALKVLPPAMAGDPIAVARFKREIKALGLCDHPNVVKVLTAGQDGDRHFYAMEYVDGCDLSALYDVLSAWGKSSSNLREGHIAEAISSAGKLSEARKQISDSGHGLSEEQVREKLAQEIPQVPQLSDGRAAYERLAELMAEAADGLQHLHDRGIIHRDLKPGNLMLTADGKRIVLMDFGLAQLENASLSLTRSADKIVGTLRYMAPEQADVQLRGELVGERSDIYSFGATLYELTTLKPIFEGSSQVQLLEQVQRKEPEAPSKANPNLPKDLETIILKATQKDRDLRYAKAGPSTEAGTVGADLKHFSKGEPISARPLSKYHYLKLFYRRNRALANTVAAAAMIFLLATSGFIYALEQRRHEAEEARNLKSIAEAEAQDRRALAERAQEMAEQARRDAELDAQRATVARQRSDRMFADWYSYLESVARLDLLVEPAMRELASFRAASSESTSERREGQWQQHLLMIGTILEEYGDYDSAQDAFELGLDSGEAGQADYAMGVELRLHASNCMLRKGNIESAKRVLHEMDLSEASGPAPPNDGLRRSLAVPRWHMQQGDAERLAAEGLPTERAKEALSSALSQYSLARKQLESHTGVVSADLWSDLLAALTQREATTKVRLGDSASAIHIYGEAIKIIDAQLSFQSKRDRTFLIQRRANLLARRAFAQWDGHGAPTQALADVEEADRDLESLQHEAAATLKWSLNRAGVQIMHSQLLCAALRYEEAALVARNAAHLLRPLRSHFPFRTDILRECWRALDWQGIALATKARKNDELDSALLCFQESWDLKVVASQMQPPVAGKRDLLEGAANLSRCLVSLGRREQAIASMRTVEEMYPLDGAIATAKLHVELGRNASSEPQRKLEYESACEALARARSKVTDLDAWRQELEQRSFDPLREMAQFNKILGQKEQ
ncbi:MAG: protein kinase [Planctomycetes bacterium]|nr:protein kinase [Planctomycetota bacterium]